MSSLTKPTPEIQGPKPVPGRIGQALRNLSREGVAVKKVLTDLLDVPMKRGEEFTDSMIDKLVEEAEQALRDAQVRVHDLSFALQLKRHDEERPVANAATKDDPAWNADPKPDEVPASQEPTTERTIDWGDAGGDGDPDNPGT